MPEYPFQAAPPAGQPIPVAEGVLWLRLPLPFALDHVNVWLIKDDDGWAVVDTGISDQRTRDLWRQVWADGLGGQPLSRLIVTHFHPDHMGLAAWLCRRFGLAMEATLGEWLYGRMLSLDHGEEFIDTSLAFYRAAGFDDHLLRLVGERGNAYGARVKHIPSNCRRIRDGQDLVIGGRRWRVMVGQGHAPEQACLWCEELGLLISGDQILPAISPNISVWPSEPAANPLREFLSSLERFRSLPAETLVLPSHGLPFRGLHARIDELIEHHDERLADVLALCRQPSSAYDLLATLFPRELDQHQLFFAVGESLAHLHFLLERGELAHDTDRAGIRRFKRR